MTGIADEFASKEKINRLHKDIERFYSKNACVKTIFCDCLKADCSKTSLWRLRDRLVTFASAIS